MCKSYHRIAGEAGLELEDFVEAGSLGFNQLLGCHLDQKAHGGVGVVLLVVSDQRRDFLCAVHHGLQNVLLVALHNTEGREVTNYN